MKKKIMLLVVIILIFVAFKADIFAEECTTSELNKLTQEAYNIKISYEHKMDNKFLVTVSGMTDNIYIYEKFNSIYFDKVNNNTTVTSAYYFYGGYLYEFNVYTSAKTNCKDKILRTVNYNIPKYNKYYGRSECKGIEEYSLCQKYYEYTIDEKEFLTRISEYKTSIKNQTKESEKTVSTKAELLDLVIQYYQLVLWIIIVSGLTTVFFIKRKERKIFK